MSPKSQRTRQASWTKMNCIIRAAKLANSNNTSKHQANRDKHHQELGAALQALQDADEAANWRPARHASGLQTMTMINDSERLTSENQICDKDEPSRASNRRRLGRSCDQGRRHRLQWACQLAAAALLVLLAAVSSSWQQSIIIDHHHFKSRHHLMMNNSDQQPASSKSLVGLSFQPASLLSAQNRSMNFTHVAVDELTGTIYLGATNWLLQVSGRELKLEQALRTGPTTSDSSLARDCTPADCLNQLAQIELDQIIPRLLVHSHGVTDLTSGGGANGLSGQWSSSGNRRPFAGATMHTSNTSSTGYALLQAHRRPAGGTQATGQQVPTTTPTTTANSGSSGQAGTSAQGGSSSASPASSQQQQLQHNNYNKILAIDYESRHLIVCGSLNQGACRRHQLGNLGNFSDLIPLPVASDDEHSSTVALIANNNRQVAPGGQQQQQQQQAGSGIFYVAATNSRLGPPNREMVPAISARSLDWSSRDRAMQIIEHSFTDLARVDISFGLRDYYLVNYVHAFQHNNFIYFATVQRKSALLQLEEWGYVTRLVRLCLNDLSFQSYAEMTLECSAPSTSSRSSSEQRHNHQHQPQQQQQQVNQGQRVNYNLLQDAHLMQAGSQLQQQLGLAGGSRSSAVLVGAFSQSRDHTTRSSLKSAICLFPMDKIEQKFQENIDLCYNGTIKSRNMDYIAGSVNDCPKQQGQSRAASSGSPQSYCNEPVKLNGSIALVAEPILTNDSELITAITSTLAPTSPVNIQWPQATPSAGATTKHQQQQTNSIRQHQVLIAGTSDGQLKRFVLVSSGTRISALEFDSISLAEPQASDNPANSQPILADLHLVPATNPQLTIGTKDLQDRASTSNRQQQFVVAATAHKLVKLRVNSCKAARPHRSASSSGQQSTATGNNSSIVDDCLACSQLQDPFCGWCSNLASCTTRDECLSSRFSTPPSRGETQSPASSAGSEPPHASSAIHWTPFDSIRCSNYQPISPKNVPIQADSSSLVVDVNVRLNLKHTTGATSTNNNQLAARLAQAQFVCHFDYLSLWNRSDSVVAPRLSGATTKAAQARLNLHAGTVAIGCPLPVSGQRPSLRQQASREHDHARVRLSVRLSSIGTSRQQQPDQQQDLDDRLLLEQVLGMRPFGRQQQHHASSAASTNQELQHHLQAADSIERELTFYDCSLNSDCRSCLSSGSLGRRWSCAWCPLSNKCTFNSSHPDFGCAASAVASTTPQSAPDAANGLSQIRGSHLTVSLDRAQTNMLGLAIDRLDRCPRASPIDGDTDFSLAINSAATSSDQGPASRPLDSAVASGTGLAAVPSANGGKQQQAMVGATASSNEILVPNNVRRSVQVPLTRPIHHYQPREKRVLKLECLVELEGAKARFSARLIDNTNIVCQESLYSYQTEIATQAARLSVILNDNQVIETTEVIIYKCHLFGVSPPAIASSVIASAAAAAAATTSSQEASSMPSDGYLNQNHHHQHSSASWSSNLNELFNLMPASGLLGQPARRQSDCSLCLNIDRKYQCAWCTNQCKHSEQCQELPESTCPPPRIDSIHPTSGPLEGGTLLTIEGSNLGSNEREIQDKILVGGEQCQLVMYSVSTRIVCKTGPSLLGAQSATVYVGNRAGVTSAYEKFDYKAVHLTDVTPRIGPVSGGTRLLLSGSNLNIGSRVQVYLDEIPCPLDSTFETTSNQIACITGPNLFASSSMRIKQLTLMIDNSTHRLPFPFTYQPDPIITSIEPAESFVSGGRLILINGQHLASPQSTKLLVYLEHRPSVTNATACQRQNETLITCLTPAFSRADLLDANQPEESNTNADDNSQQQQQQQQQGLSYESGGIKLKMALLMDDVKSVRNLDEYYHHLPHYITYFDDPQLLRLSSPVVEFRDELVIAGRNLAMKQLDQDMQISIGAHICLIKSIQPDRIVVEPPSRIAPVFEYLSDRGRALVDKPLLPIVALIGANLRFELGQMQYSSSQYLAMPSEPIELNAGYPTPDLIATEQLRSLGLATTSVGQFYPGQPVGLHESQQSPSGNSVGFVVLLVLSLMGFVVAISVALMFALARFRQSKAEQREYKRIQLQMGSLDMNCQSPGGGGGSGSVFASGLFDKIHLPSMGINNNQATNQRQLFANQQLQHRPMDYATKNKPLYQFFSGQQQQQQQPPLPSSFPPSPLTDISSLIGSSPGHPHQQHIVKLNANGQIVSSSASHQQQQQPQHQYAYAGGLLLEQHHQPQQQQQQLQAAQPGSSSSSSSTGSSPSRQTSSLANQHNQPTSQRGSSARNFNWTQEAPSTIVPYAVIEACNLTLEGKNAIKEFV